MKILWLIHGYPPVKNAGAEWMAHDMNRYLIKHHDVRVISCYDGSFDGVEVHNLNIQFVQHHLDWCDVVITHLGMSALVWNKVRKKYKPMVFVTHNTNKYNFLRQEGVFIIHNSNWVNLALNYPRPHVIVNPPVYWDRWKRSRGDKIGLVNINEAKGGKVLRQLAQMMPDRKFLGVIGGYGKQETNQPDNVEIINNTPDMQAVYDKCRIIIMPSVYESWGRVGVEAMACGIPVIAHPTPGLKESLGSAGLFANRDVPMDWVSHIKALDDKNVYISQVEKCMQRARDLDPLPQMERLNEFLHGIHSHQIT